MKPGERKIPNDTAMLMTGIAVFLDLICILVGLIPFAGLIVDFIIAGIFYLWFDHYDVKLFGERNWAGSVVALGLNAFPITNLAFPWVIRVGSLAFTAKKEEPPKQVRATASTFRL